MKFASAAGQSFGLDDLPVAASYSLGIWEKLGLEVEWVKVRGAVKSMEALERGDSVVSYGGYGAALAKRSKWDKLRIIASTTLTLAQEVVGRSNLPTSDVDPVLRWAVDGIGAMSHQLAIEVIKAFSLDADRIEFVVCGPPEDRIQALASGRVDVSLLRLEEALQLTREDNSLSKLLSFEEINSRVTNPVHGVIATSEIQIMQHREDIQKVVTGLIESSRTLKYKFAEFAKAMQSTSKIDLSADDLHLLWQRSVNANLFALDGGMNDDRWHDDIQHYCSMNKGMMSVETNEVLDHAFVKRAMMDLVGSANS